LARPSPATKIPFPSRHFGWRIDIAEVAGDETVVEQTSKSLGDLRIAEIVKLDMQLDANGKVEVYRSKSNYRSNTRAPDRSRSA
jgi:flavin-binding protein dodecin